MPGHSESGRPMMNVPGLYHQATDRQHGFDSQHGQQFAAAWAAGEGGTKPIMTVEPAPALWRVSVFGDLLLRVTWGTSSTLSIDAVQAPFVATLPGRVTIEGRQRDPAVATNAFCTLTPASAGQLPVFRTVQTIPGPLPFCAYRVTALTAATVTVAGVAVVLVAGASLPVIDDSSLTAGTVLVELAP